MKIFAIIFIFAFIGATFAEEEEKESIKPGGIFPYANNVEVDKILRANLSSLKSLAGVAETGLTWAKFNNLESFLHIFRDFWHLLSNFSIVKIEDSSFQPVGGIIYRANVIFSNASGEQYRYKVKIVEE